MIKVVCWNIHRLNKSLDQLAEMAENEEADVALLQEVGPGMAHKLRPGLETGSRKHWDSRLWSSRHPSRWTMVVKMSDRVEVEWLDQVGQDSEPSKNEIALSRVNSLGVARVIPKDKRDGKSFMVASIYAHSQKPPYGSSRATRAIANDLSAFIGRNVADSDRILAAGDVNVNYVDYEKVAEDYQAEKLADTLEDEFGYVYRIYEDGERYTVVIHYPDGEIFRLRRRRWKYLGRARYWSRTDIKKFAELRCKIASGDDERPVSVWDRMKKIGLEFMGPQHPNGRQPDSFPSFVPANSENVVTYYDTGGSPETGFRQLDYVFASSGFHERVSTRALNGVEEWGASDHCRIMIEVAPE